MRDVFVAGTGVVRFAPEPRPLEDLVLDAGLSAHADSGVKFDDLQAVYMGYSRGGATVGLGLMKEFGLTGIPIQHIENASATGASAFREAYLAVAGGHVDIALALGFDSFDPEMARGTPRPRRREGGIPPVGLFAMWARRRMHDYGTTRETLAEIAAKNWNHGRLCPWSLRQADHEVTAGEVLASRLVADPLTSMMCCPSEGSGAAAAVLVSRHFLKKLDDARPKVKVLASAQQSERFIEGHVFIGAVVGPSQMTADTALEAYERAGIGPEDLSLVQIHDAFAIEELVYYELLGICGEGEGDKLVSSAETKIGGRIPFSTDGGLLARGHPVGPTGLAQIHETVLQLRGEAGERQVENARIGMCHLVGADSSCVIHILGR